MATLVACVLISSITLAADWQVSDPADRSPTNSNSFLVPSSLSLLPLSVPITVNGEVLTLVYDDTSVDAVEIARWFCSQHVLGPYCVPSVAFRLVDEGAALLEQPMDEHLYGLASHFYENSRPKVALALALAALGGSDGGFYDVDEYVQGTTTDPSRAPPGHHVVQLFNLVAACYHATDDFVEATRYFSVLRSLFPGDPDLLVNYAVCSFGSGEYQQAKVSQCARTELAAAITRTEVSALDANSFALTISSSLCSSPLLTS